MLHGGFQPVHIGEGVFHPVSGCGGVEEVAGESEVVPYTSSADVQ